MFYQMHFWKVVINMGLSLPFLHILKSKPCLIRTSEELLLIVINTGTGKTLEISVAKKYVLNSASMTKESV